MKLLSVHFGLPLCLFLFLLGLLWRGLALHPNELPSVLIGKPAPGFYLPTIADPNHFVTEKIFKGQVTLLNVWTTWCKTCQHEHSVWMQIMANKAKEKSLDNVWLIGLNYHDKILEVQKWLKATGDPYAQILFDQEGRVGIHYGVYATPETFLIDKEGIIRYRHVGPINLEIWQQKLFPLIQVLQ